jgi:chemotaxis protein methyltransferase CheR
MMYFSPGVRREIIQNFHRSLVDGAWLVVSSVEVQSSAFRQFHTRSFPGATLYQKSEIPALRTSERGSKITAPVPLSPLPDTSKMPEVQPMNMHGLPWTKLPDGEAAKKEPLAPEAGSPRSKKSMSGDQAHAGSHEKSGTYHRTARAHANEGQLGEAIKWCEKAIAADKLNAANHYLMATLQLESGRDENAAQSLLRTLYLDPDFVLAHFALANLHLSQGRKREAAHYFGATLSLLRDVPPDALLPESEGLPAGQLIDIIHSLDYPAALNCGDSGSSHKRKDARGGKLNG